MVKYVNRIPLRNLWTDDLKEIKAKRGRRLTTSDIQSMLQVGTVTFVVANLGTPLQWIQLDECFRFWKSIKNNIADEEEIFLDNYPDEFAYVATEWNEESGERIILLETHH